MSSFIEQAAEYSADGVAWLQPFRQHARHEWLAQSFPTRKTERWKYTSLRSLDNDQFLQALPCETGDYSSRFKASAIEGLDSYRLPIVNGQLSNSFDESTAPEGVSVVRFSDANHDQQQLIEDAFVAQPDAKKHLFTALNAICFTDGLLIHVAANAQVEQAIELCFINQAEEQQTGSVHSRVLVVLETSAQAKIIEHYPHFESSVRTFNNAMLQLVVGANARIDHYRLQLQRADNIHVAGVHAELKKDALLQAFNFIIGGKINRLDYEVKVNGEGSHAEINGIYLPVNDEHTDIHTDMEHLTPHCTSNEVFRGIIGDKARAVFNGRIHIVKGAQKTNAQLSNKNLLASDTAEVNTKPELEIYANDVLCSHGATVAQLDKELLYYMRSRGIDRKSAEMMLSYGFVNELIADIRIDAIADYLRPMVQR
jgi:Fe-S cluster assembly protein SufD